ncbi:FAD-dependent monooxygenase [Pseudomonas sp. LMG 31766]|uniref:FAD-dependent oxidoreductase n=1 Tax=Pseudomonas chaetocerotis TaxID=2758695 RepID=UPI001CCA5A90|nr:NAD(P)/FAD-dependent oxidoreductase [Pseudomonas chaetocerotis]MBZ9666104.1 FAD-dependent monooxygenase [Pseudomonas chaetocerotis]
MNVNGLPIAIVGAGTAGLASAIFLARQGYAVRLLERVERLQPVGAGILLQPSGLAVLQRLGLLAECTALGAPVSRLYGTSCQGRVILDTRYHDWQPGSFGLGIHRGVLMTALLNAAQCAGVQVETGVTVSRFEQASGHVRLLRQSEAGDEQPLGDFAALILADGTRSTLRAQMQIRQWSRPYPWGALWSMLPTSPATESGELRQWYRGCREMFGLMPTGCTHQARENSLTSLFWSLPLNEHESWRSSGLGAWKNRVRSLAGEAAEAYLQQIDDPAQLTLAAYADVRMQRWNDGRVLAIGDCAHAMSPQLGQGANMALVDAAALADALGNAGDQHQHALDWNAIFTGYGDARRDHLRYYRQASRLLTPLFQSNSNTLAVLRDIALMLARHNRFGRQHAVSTLVGARGGWLWSGAQKRELHAWKGEREAWE